MSGKADAVEFCSWGNLYGGIVPYSLCDWYRYLNNGYHVPAVGGTDKMSAGTAVGTVRSFARIPAGHEFTYEAWKDAVRRGETFVSYGPLLQMTVDGRPMGSRLTMTSTGGTVDVSWHVASVTIPMTRVELVVNGEVVDGTSVDTETGSGSFSVQVGRSSWLALLVRGMYADRPEMIASHSSAVMIDVERTPHYAAADSLSILQQIEGALAYLETLGTRADTATYRRMRLKLTGIHRDLHNRMHQLGHYHQHAAVAD